jgi:replicative DNA helicase
MVNLENIQTGDLYGNESVKITSALEQIKNTKIYFDDTPNQMLGDIVAKSRKLQAAHPDLCAIFVDYLNLITTGEASSFDSRAQEVSLITRTLKELARSLNIPIIALAQLNRDVDKTDQKIPSLSNLKESGSIEQDADMVLLMYRKDYYTSMGQSVNAKEKGYGAQSEFTKNVQAQVDNAKAMGKDTGNISTVQILLAKNRNGRTGQITLLFSKNYQRFDNPSPEMEKSEARINGVSVSPDEE